MKKEFFCPVLNVDNPYDVQLVPVTEEFYRSVVPEIDRIRKQIRRSGRCVCPKYKLCACDANCTVCPYNACGNTVSFGAPLDDAEGLTSATPSFPMSHPRKLPLWTRPCLQHSMMSSAGLTLR